MSSISFCRSILEQVRAGDVDEVFHEPLCPDDFVGGMGDYLRIVERPMDLRTAGELLEADGDEEAFRNNMLLMFYNCELYNRPSCRSKYPSRCDCVACYGARLRRKFETLWEASACRCDMGIKAGQHIAAHVHRTPLIIFGRVEKVHGDIVEYDPVTVHNFAMMVPSPDGPEPSFGTKPFQEYLVQWTGDPVSIIRIGNEDEHSNPPSAGVWKPEQSRLAIDRMMNNTPRGVTRVKILQ